MTELDDTAVWANQTAKMFEEMLLNSQTEQGFTNKSEEVRLKALEVVERRKQYMRDGLVYDATTHDWVKKVDFDTTHELGWQQWLESMWFKKNKEGVPKLADLMNMGSLF